MEVLKIDNLFARRSVREFTPGAIADAQIELLLKAAMASANAGNRQPWHYIVIKDPDTRIKLALAHPYAKMAADAALVIIPCGEPGASIPGLNDYWIQDLAASTENLLLAVTALGLGAVWCGVYPNSERVEVTRRLLNIPMHIVPFAFVCIGYPGEEKEPRTQYNAERVHYNSW
ncbi:MAG: nitroreductase family protein [Chloroflexi bacterium]|nr:nitroreductase family protein [Chloroflexota bacterium]